LIPPRKNARIWQHGNSKEKLFRETGYHIRSLAETIMFRLKIIFGDRFSARLLETQNTQALIRCLALNKMTHFGMPYCAPLHNLFCLSLDLYTKTI
jgi:hypothetical protein